MLSGEPRLLVCSAGSLFGIVCSPDQDVNGGNISNNIIRKKVGWFGERLWRWFWRGYSSSFKHGQFASHFPIFSTLVRLGYIYFMTILPFYTVYFLILHSSNYQHWLMTELYYWVGMFTNFYFLYGLISSDIIHYALDKLTKNME